MGIFNIIKNMFSGYNSISNDGSVHIPGDVKYYCTGKCVLNGEEVSNNQHDIDAICGECRSSLRIRCKYCNRYLDSIEMFNHLHYRRHGMSCYERYGYD